MVPTRRVATTREPLRICAVMICMGPMYERAGVQVPHSCPPRTRQPLLERQHHPPGMKSTCCVDHAGTPCPGVRATAGWLERDNNGSAREVGEQESPIGSRD